MNAFYELVGYTASFIVLVSLLMPSLWRLRILNLVGALTFVGYGILIGAAPVAVVNFLIAVIDVYYLLRMRREAAADPTRTGERQSEPEPAR